MLIRSLLFLFATVAVVTCITARLSPSPYAGVALAQGSLASSNAVAAQVAAGAAPNLIVTITDTPDPVDNTGSEDPPISYVVTVTNNGTAPTTANFAPSGTPFVIIHFPFGLNLPDPPTYLQTGAGVTCTYLPVAKPGDQEQVGDHIDFGCYSENAIGTGASQVISFGNPAPPPSVNVVAVGCLTAHAIADPQGAQVELNELDNRASANTRVITNPQGPNCVNPTATPAAPTSTRTSTPSATATATGNTTTPSSTATPTATGATTNTLTATITSTATTATTATTTPTLTLSTPVTSTSIITATPTATATPSATPTSATATSTALTGTPTTTATPFVGGKNLRLQVGGSTLVQGGGSEAINLTWDDGTLETGYLVIRFSPTRGYVFFPSNGSFLAADASFFSQTPPATDSFYCYFVVAFGGNPTTLDQFLGISDVLCFYPGSGIGPQAPTGLRIGLNQTTLASLSWIPAGGQDAYRLTAFTVDSPLPRVQQLPANAVGQSDNTQSKLTCYKLEALSLGKPIGSAPVVCAVPNVASFPGVAGGNLSDRLNEALRQLTFGRPLAPPGPQPVAP